MANLFLKMFMHKENMTCSIEKSEHNRQAIKYLHIFKQHQQPKEKIA